MRGLLLDRRSYRRSVAQDVVTRRIGLFRIKDYAVRWSTDMGMAGIDAGIDDGDLEPMPSHTGTAAFIALRFSLAGAT